MAFWIKPAPVVEPSTPKWLITSVELGPLRGWTQRHLSHAKALDFPDPVDRINVGPDQPPIGRRDRAAVDAWQDSLTFITTQSLLSAQLPAGGSYIDLDDVVQLFNWSESQLRIAQESLAFPRISRRDLGEEAVPRFKKVVLRHETMQWREHVLALSAPRVAAAIA